MGTSDDEIHDACIVMRSSSQSILRMPSFDFIARMAKVRSSCRVVLLSGRRVTKVLLDTSQRVLGNIASTSYPQGIDLLGSRRPLAFDSNLVEDDEKPGPPTSDVSGGDLSHSPPSSPAYTPPRRHSDTLHAVNLFSKPLPKIPEGSPTKRRSASPKRVDRRLLHKQVRLSSVPDLSRPESGLDSDASAPSRNRASTALTSILAGALKRRVGTGFESADVEGLD